MPAMPHEFLTSHSVMAGARNCFTPSLPSRPRRGFRWLPNPGRIRYPPVWLTGWDGNCLHGQADADRGAPARAGPDGELATEFGLDQGPHDLQPQAGMRVQGEPFGQPRPVVLHADLELPGATG